MRSPSPSSRRADRLLAALLLLVVAACGRGDERAAGVGTPDRVLVGPQGRTGQFVVECALSHYLADDPIVHPGRPGGSHLHQFFGSVAASVDSGEAEMLAGDTTCDQRADTASYWTPVLLDADREPVEPIRAVAYYTAGPDVPASEVVAYPPGLMMVAGDHTAIEPQPVSVVAWSCGTGAAVAATPPDCAGAPSLRMTVTFPDCWDGVHVRSPIVPDPDLHVRYSTAGACPSTHPVPIPQLRFAVDYPPVGADDLDALALSSGSVLTGHADFWNTWDQVKLANEVTQCLHRDLPCGVSG